MFSIDYGQGQTEGIASVWTLCLYEQEFGGDLIKDVFRSSDEQGSLFETENWTCLIKALWACLKAKDDTLPPFKAWAKDIGEIDLLAVQQELPAHIARGLFRHGGDTSS